jgi:hypothetical protein
VCPQASPLWRHSVKVLRWRRAQSGRSESQIAQKGRCAIVIHEGPRIDRLLTTAERRHRGDGALCGIEGRVAVELSAGNGSGKAEKSNAKRGTNFVSGTFRA